MTGRQARRVLFDGKMLRQRVPNKFALSDRSAAVLDQGVGEHAGGVM
jgi:hypothetical protein